MIKILCSLLFMTAFLHSLSAQTTPKTETAILGGGCFWCTEGVYLMIPGVVKVTSGYANGHVENPTYRQVCEGTTGHNEVIQVDFDPAKISYRELIDLFWFAHDPTTLNRQGNDIGTQYRSGIYYLNEQQKQHAEASKQAHNVQFQNKIVTEIEALKKFYPAEDYHQNYVANNPDNGYVCAVAIPKMKKFQVKLKEFQAKRAKLTLP